MSYFTALDWVVIVLYLGGIAALGLRFGPDQKNTRDYFLGSRDIPWWGIGFSIVAAETSALTIISVPAMSFGDGGNLAFIQMPIGYVIGRIVLAIYLVPHYFKGEIYSPYQLFAQAYGDSARRAAAGLFVVMETLAAGVRVYVACIPVQLLLGMGLGPSIVLFIGVALAYTAVGGIKAVIWTDAAQFVLFLAGGLATLGLVASAFPGGWGEVMRMAAAEGKLHWFNPGFALAKPFNIWMGVIGGAVMALSTHGAEQLIVQRVLACRGVADGRKALVLSAVLILPLFLIFLLVGVSLWAWYQTHTRGIPIPEVRPGIKANDFVYPIFMLTGAPTILRGFLIVAILSAAMSSVSSALTSLASVSTMDLLKPLLPGRSENFFLRLSKASTVVWAVLLAGVAFLSREVEFVLNTAFSLRGLTSGALLGGLILCLYGKRGSPVPVMTGMGASFAVMLLLSFKLGDAIFWPWYTLIGTVVCLTVSLSTGLLARQTARSPK